jgi:hypothetical protein
MEKYAGMVSVHMKLYEMQKLDAQMGLDNDAKANST